MSNGPLPDHALMKMPSFKAMRSFVAAAKHRNFSRAAQTLCVTQAAISRQIRDLEVYLGTELFIRTGRELELTEQGVALFDAAQLSLLNIFQATERIRRVQNDNRRLTLCCSPAMSTLWLAPRLTGFIDANPDVDLNVITTQHVLNMEPGVHPDIFITKRADPRPGYQHIPLFHEKVYPVCTPAFLAANPQVRTLEGLRQSRLLDLNPYGRSQLSEQVGWEVWFAFQSPDDSSQPEVDHSQPYFSSNDYGLLIQMALDSKGLVLGWDHLVRHHLQQGRLVRPVEGQIILRESLLYLVVNEQQMEDPATCHLKDWLIAQFA